MGIGDSLVGNGHYAREANAITSTDEVPPCGIERIGLSAAIQLHPVDNEHNNVQKITLWYKHSWDKDVG